ncbi:MAG TPA: DUF4244 domain-containing protein [Amnibacterium sp.]|jgi:Flp pilus assembly pilin Flp|uniref:DUF4244 domain-containing protein n=1 Tax=Amnibacterium sp. TaxID=1872496 RepID=UPI002F95F5A8
MLRSTLATVLAASTGLDPRDESGAVTAEYAIATIAAVGFAALLVVVLRSDEVRGMLTDLIRHALALPA